VLALLCLAMALTPAAAFAGSISGTVTDAETLEPIQGVEVCASSQGGGGCARTDAAGKYELKGLPEGEYIVDFWGPYLGYATEYYDNKKTWEQADPVVVGSEPVTGIDAALGPRPGITGTVTRSSDGEPVEEVEVCALPLVPKVEGTSRECGYTQPDGTYYVGLEPGIYMVKFWPGWSGQNLAFQFYDGKNRINDSDKVTVEPGERTNGIDAELEPGATISGTVSSAASGLGLKEIPVCSIDALTGGLLTCGWTEPGGNYSLLFLSAGPYKVVFSIDFGEWFGEPPSKDDRYPTQFWDNQVRLATADLIPLSTGQSVGGIDARLGNPLTRSVVAPPPVHHRRKHCRKGYVRKKVKGKVRCVKRHKHHRHHHHR
jgi:hypothetical protein